jgi:hypothetical protein
LSEPPQLLLLLQGRLPGAAARLQKEQTLRLAVQLRVTLQQQQQQQQWRYLQLLQLPSIMEARQGVRSSCRRAAHGPRVMRQLWRLQRLL